MNRDKYITSDDYKEGYLDGVKEGSKAATADFKSFLKKWEYDMQCALAHMEENDNK